MWICICWGWQFEEIFDDYERGDDDDARDDDKGDDDDDKGNENDDHDRYDDSKCFMSVFPFFVTSVTRWETTRGTSGLRLSSSYNCLFAFCFSLFWLHTYKYEFKYSSLTTVLSVLFLTLSFLVLWIRKQIDIQLLRITSYSVYLLFAFPFPFHLYILLRVQCTFIDVCLRLCRTSWEQLKLSLRSTSLFICTKWSAPSVVESDLLLQFL